MAVVGSQSWCRRTSALLVLLFMSATSLLQPTVALPDVSPNSLLGTQGLETGLTAKQLAILNAFANYTLLACNGHVDIKCVSWEHWPAEHGSATCDNNACLRYQVSAIGYAAALAAVKTPSYNSTYASLLLRNSIHRMLDVRVWQYVTMFDDYRRQPTYPDPVAYKNIMYSGHLAQLLTLYEAITGDDVFESQGFEFVFNETLSFHYTTSRLLNTIATQMDSRRGHADAGIACEPDSIFVICNCFPRNAFTLRMAMAQRNVSMSGGGPCDPLDHGIAANGNGKVDGTKASNAIASNATLFQDVNQRWAQTISTHGQTHLGEDASFFKLDYLIFPGIWEPVATVGSDAWALAWMKPWFQATTISPEDSHPQSQAQPDLPQAAYRHMLNSSRWRFVNTSQNDGGAYLHVEQVLDQKLFPFNDAVTTSLWPLIEKQFNASAGNKDARTAAAISWMEQQFGRLRTLPGGLQTYLYETQDNYELFASANLLAGMLHPSPSNAASTDDDSMGRAAGKVDNSTDWTQWLSNLFQFGSPQGKGHPPHWQQVQTGLFIASAPFPQCLVMSAVHDGSNHVLNATITSGNMASVQDAFDVTVAGISSCKNVEASVDGTSLRLKKTSPNMADVRVPAFDSPSQVRNLRVVCK